MWNGRSCAESKASVYAVRNRINSAPLQDMQEKNPTPRFGDIMRIAVVGIGSIGSAHIDRLLSMGYTDLVGVDPRPMPDDERLPIITEFDDFGAWEPTHAIICSPPEFHYHHALHFLKQGIPVLIEKPMTTTARDAEALCDFAKRRRLTLAVGYMERANPAVIYAKEVASRHEICMASIECYWMMTGKTYRQVMIAESSHAIDTARFICGSFSTARVRSINSASADIEMRRDSDDLSCSIIINAQASPMRRITLYTNINNPYLRIEYGHTKEEWGTCYRTELQAFLDGKPLCIGEDGLAVMRMLEEVRHA